MVETELFKLPLLAENQTGRVDLIHNEAIQGLELLSNLSIASRSLQTPPNTPQIAFYLPLNPAAGAWIGKENKLAFYYTELATWRFYSPPIGFRAYCIEEEIDLRWDGTNWIEINSNTSIISSGIKVYSQGQLIADNILEINFDANFNVIQESLLWTPTDISALILFWLEANSGFNDKSSAARTTLNSNNKPTITTNALNGQSIFSFTNTKALAYDNSFDPQLVSIFAVFKNTTTDVRILNISNNSNTNSVRAIFDLNPIRFRVNPPDITYSGGSLNSNWHLFEIRGSDLSFYHNGSSFPVNTLSGNLPAPNSLTSSNIVINAAFYNTTTATFSVLSSEILNLAELLVIQKTASVADHNRITGYLAHKYGLAANLPSGHLYKNTAPTQTTGTTGTRVTVTII